ncbi:MAG: glycogen synthase GlgA [Verrucomicrobiota bacterium]
MHVLIASSEFHPFSKTGGLADAVGALARWVARSGLEVTVVTPLYQGIEARAEGLEPARWRFSLPLGPRFVDGAFRCLALEPRCTVWFVDQAEFYDRPGLYGVQNRDHPDNAERFLFLAKAALLVARHHPRPPSVVHAHDWQTGLLPLLVHHARVAGGWERAPRTLFTIHNLAYQGWFPSQAWGLTNLPPAWFHLESASHGGGLNFLKGALCLADALSTVSPRYAREICTPEFGCGFDGLLRRREHDLTGILNGVDYGEWNTTANPFLPHAYDADHLAGKEANKAALQRELGLEARPDLPLFANVSRLTDQKGCDLLLEALEQLLPAVPLQFAVLGGGDPALEAAFARLARRHPGRAAARLGFNPGLAHRMEAGADFYLMPSRFEPCGLNQLYSLRYGAVPVVRATGGLDDSVVDPRESRERANGLKFTDPQAPALVHGLHKALALHAAPPALAHFRRNGMTADFSWEKQAREYVRFYDEILHGP